MAYFKVNFGIFYHIWPVWALFNGSFGVFVLTLRGRVVVGVAELGWRWRRAPRARVGGDRSSERRTSAGQLKKYSKYRILEPRGNFVIIKS